MLNSISKIGNSRQNQQFSTMYQQTATKNLTKSTNAIIVGGNNWEILNELQ